MGNCLLRYDIVKGLSVVHWDQNLISMSATIFSAVIRLVYELIRLPFLMSSFLKPLRPNRT